jgi:hypothetical protein
MASEFLAGLGIFETIYESANALKEINDASVRNTAVIELKKSPRCTRSAIGAPGAHEDVR